MLWNLLIVIKINVVIWIYYQFSIDSKKAVCKLTPCHPKRLIGLCYHNYVICYLVIVIRYGLTQSEHIKQRICEVYVRNLAIAKVWLSVLRFTVNKSDLI